MVLPNPYESVEPPSYLTAVNLVTHRRNDDGTSLTEEEILQRLSDYRDHFAITDEEFQWLKHKLKHGS